MSDSTSKTGGGKGGSSQVGASCRAGSDGRGRGVSGGREMGRQRARGRGIGASEMVMARADENANGGGEMGRQRER